MRKLLGAIVSSAVCVALSFSTTGCTPKPKEGKKEFALATTGSDKEIEKKDGAIANIKTEHGEITDVSIAPSGKGVTAAADGKKMVQVKIATAKEVTEKEYKITIKGKGTDDNVKTLEAYTIKVKEPTAAAAQKFSASSTSVSLDAKDKAADVTFKHGKVKEVSNKDSKVAEAKIGADKDKVTFKALTAPKDDAQVATFVVTPDAGDPVTITVTIPGKTNVPAADKFSASSTTVTLKAKDETADVTFKNGKVKEVSNKDSKVAEAKIGADKDKVTFKALAAAKDDAQTATFIVTPDAGEPVTITVTIPAAGKVPAKDAFKASETKVSLDAKGMTAEVTFKNSTIKEVSNKDSKVAEANIGADKDKVIFKALADATKDPQVATFIVTPEIGDPVTITVTIKKQ